MNRGSSKPSDIHNKHEFTSAIDCITTEAGFAE